MRSGTTSCCRRNRTRSGPHEVLINQALSSIETVIVLCSRLSGNVSDVQMKTDPDHRFSNVDKGVGGQLTVISKIDSKAKCKS